MPYRAKLPGDDVLYDLAIRQRMTNREIAEKYDVTQEAVRQRMAKMQLRAEPERVSHGHFMPWRMRADHRSSKWANTLMLYSSYRQGRELRPGDEEYLQEFISWMEGENKYKAPLSIHYDRQLGFWTERRREGDRDLISPPAA